MRKMSKNINTFGAQYTVSRHTGVIVSTRMCVNKLLMPHGIATTF